MNYLTYIRRSSIDIYVFDKEYLIRYNINQFDITNTRKERVIIQNVYRDASTNCSC